VRTPGIAKISCRSLQRRRLPTAGTPYYLLDRIQELTGVELRAGADRTDVPLTLWLAAYRTAGGGPHPGPAFDICRKNPPKFRSGADPPPAAHDLA
jgi:hypothetical protein